VLNFEGYKSGEISYYQSHAAAIRSDQGNLLFLSPCTKTRRRTSIHAARVVDDFANPEMTIQQQLHEPRIAAGPMRGMAHADLKHCSGGSRGTFAAAEYYLDVAKQRRDELLAKVASSSDES
jgi:hypothetical protein